MEEVRLYIIDTDIFINKELFESVYCQLDEARQQKIDRAKFDADKRRSLGAGYLLKAALDELGIKDGDRELACGEHGKPYLPLCPQVRFNLSHSARFVVLAINAAAIELGCDIEEYSNKKTIKTLENVSRRVLSDKEKSMLGEPASENDTEWKQKFYDIWTAKESYVKLTGKGLGTDFRKLELSLNEDNTTITDVDSGDCRYIFKKKIADGYSFSLCLENKDVIISNPIIPGLLQK